jgi:hypothetical protein
MYLPPQEAVEKTMHGMHHYRAPCGCTVNDRIAHTGGGCSLIAMELWLLTVR